jgi:hypothetical protein
MKVKTLAAGILAVAMGSTGTAPALAHHSRSNFDLDSVVEIEGVVTEFSWRNPHAYAVVERTKEDGTKEKWTFELNSTPVLKRFGWTPDTLKVGDHVVARGNPDRDPQRRFIYANVFVKDGHDIVAWGGPAVKGPKLAARGSKDFSGVWRIRFDAGYDVLGRNRPDTQLVNTLPVTAKGQAEIDAFDADDNPAWSCGAVTMPQILGYPYPFQIIHDGDDRLLLRYEVDNLERVVHLNMDTHPANAEPTPLGHSIGRFEDGDLVIETADFAPVVWGNGRGVDSSEQRTTVERYSLNDDGTRLSLVYTMRDPVYLSEPVTVEHEYNLLADYELQDYTCDPETARRHLTAGED